MKDGRERGKNVKLKMRSGEEHNMVGGWVERQKERGQAAGTARGKEGEMGRNVKDGERTEHERKEEYIEYL